jgi:diacylglycerol kinase (ATP)
MTLRSAEPTVRIDMNTEKRAKPERITGIRHFFAAAGYSWAGLRRVWGETAFRHEALAGVVLLGVLAGIGASLQQLAIAFALVMGTIAVEVLNTAIECLVDFVSPEWSQAAKDAKDLGSLAVMCMLIGTGGYGALVIYSVLFQS